MLKPLIFTLHSLKIIVDNNYKNKEKKTKQQQLTAK